MLHSHTYPHSGVPLQFLFHSSISQSFPMLVWCSLVIVALWYIFFFYFYSYFIYLFFIIYFWLCWVFGSCEGLLRLRQVGATLHRGAGTALLRGARASHHRGPSRCGAQAPDAQAQQLWLTGPAAPRHVGSSQTRTRTRVPCINRQILNHCATREALWYILISSMARLYLFSFFKQLLAILAYFSSWWTLNLLVCILKSLGFSIRL